MKTWLPYLLLPALLFFNGCRPPQTTNTKQGKYSEDLTAYRPAINEPQTGNSAATEEPKRDPKAYVEPRYSLNKQVDSVLDSIDRLNLTRQFIDGFTIQIYSGLKRDDALTVKKNMLSYLPHLETDVQYVQPNFRVKTGRYYTRLDAQADYMAIKRYFPGAIVVPDKIPIN
ncbi:MAG: hypothetical protein ACK4RF_00365 [Cyclobacteriaceae bacterium]